MVFSLGKTKREKNKIFPFFFLPRRRVGRVLLFEVLVTDASAHPLTEPHRADGGVLLCSPFLPFRLFVYPIFRPVLRSFAFAERISTYPESRPGWFCALGFHSLVTNRKSVTDGIESDGSSPDHVDLIL